MTNYDRGLLIFCTGSIIASCGNTVGVTVIGFFLAIVGIITVGVNS